MCRSIESQRKARNDFLARVAGLGATHKHEIYELRDGIRDLIGFFAVFNSTEADFFRVNKNDTVSCEGYIPYYGGMGPRKIARMFGGDYAVAM